MNTEIEVARGWMQWIASMEGSESCFFLLKHCTTTRALLILFAYSNPNMHAEESESLLGFLMKFESESEFHIIQDCL